MSQQTTSAHAVLNFIVAKQNASESAPCRIGNVDFWHPVPGYPVGLCYSHPVNQWNGPAIQADLNRLATPIWDELIAHLNLQTS